jgi:hypothetical protein
MHDSWRGSVPQRLALWMVVLLAGIAGVVAGATTASAATFAYDVTAIASVEVHESADVPASTVQLDVWEDLAPPSARSRDSSTTPSSRRNATEAGSAVNVSTDGYSAEDPSAMGRLFG